jgi:hypothetical protein
VKERLPWSKFSWAAWENDPALALVSMAAQGFWMRLLCIAAKEGGYVLVGGLPPTPAKLARIVRASEAEVLEWLAELEAEKVCKKTGTGTIYSKRMVDDAKVSRINSENGKKGGNPTLRKDDGNSDPLNHDGKPLDEEGLKQKREEEKRREEKREDQAPALPVDTELGIKADVAKLWALTNATSRGRSSRGQVEKAFRAALNRGHSAEAILAGFAGYFESKEATKDRGEFSRGAHRIIEGDRWLEFSPAGSVFDAGLRPSDPSAPQEWMQRNWMEEFREGRFQWQPTRGPAPGDPGCRVSPEIQREFGVEPAKPQPVERIA